MVTFRKATPNDLSAIVGIYDELHTEQENLSNGTNIGWKRGVYPTKEIAEGAISIGDMFVEEDCGVIVASARINHIQLNEYSFIDWKYPASEDQIMVLHTLAVSPNLKQRGYGTNFVNFYEKYALEKGCQYLRIDTWEKNHIARALYQKLGYDEVGFVSSNFNGISDFNLVCLEKKI